jgi:hypothetical protein
MGAALSARSSGPLERGHGLTAAAATGSAGPQRTRLSLCSALLRHLREPHDCQHVPVSGHLKDLSIVHVYHTMPAARRDQQVSGSHPLARGRPIRHDLSWRKVDHLVEHNLLVRALANDYLPGRVRLRSRRAGIRAVVREPPGIR